ncbi:amino acid adenylation domain-containing protein [Nocardia yamanashiensis]|uniref:non-ribosomal peptide synthetase n=1 Tax=Nocardia yamanashiensis TaxID=209247 RepID=UPI001E30A2F5|nr:non-ribosomal peptide synthetase [Nocardia yamanashiensis]UGT39784.1 amino acid adenylation domain-containing protein [Nocardia yamanashiensis]
METARRSARGNRRRRSGSQLFGQLLTASVESAADSVAIRFNPTGEPADQRELTYRELDEASSKLARELIERGVGPGDVVGIGISRSIESVLAVWAIAKAGAAYVPVDPKYPADRIEYLLSDSRAVLGVTVAEHRAVLGDGVEWLQLDDPATAARIEARPAHTVSYADRVRPLTEQHPAYLIYTSGSTGKPKGVVVTHTGLGGLVAAEREHYAVEPGSRVLHVCSPNFDVSVLELLLAFSSGSTLVVSPPTVFGGADLSDLLRRERVSHMLITPAALESVDSADLDDLKVVVVAGDKFGPELVARWAAPGRAFYNGYGPTEATILATSSAAMVPGEPITIGSAIPGVGAFVLDTRLRPVPAGVIGELYLSGPALAQGYLGRPGLTAERFVASPFGGEENPGARLYRTGDLVRYNREDGVIEYLGRSDFQVKIRGFRIELGEIDNALTAHPDIDFAATMGKTLPSGATALVAYVLPAAGRAVDTAALAEFVGQSLPPHMVPSAIMVLSELPLTPNGKLDRAALPEPVFPVTTSRAPSGPVETQLAELFAQLLRTEEVGADDSFFAIGGDSIMSIQLVSRARALGIVFTPQDVFEQRTVAGLAKVAVVGDENVIAALEELPGGGTGEIPLTPVLAEYLKDGVSDRFSQSMVLTLPDGIDRAGIADTLTAVLTHHDVLRARLRRTADGWTLQVPPATEIDADALIAETDFPAGVEGAELARLGSAAMDSTMAALDPVAGRMVTATWVRRPDAADLLLLVAHHYVIDGVSWRILISDLVLAWMQRAAGQRPSLPGVGTSFRRWAHALTEVAADDTRRAEIDYWRQALTAPDPLLGARALDAAVDTYATVRRFNIQVPAEVTEAVLTEVPALYRGGVNDGLLAALALAVRSWRERRGVDAPVTRVRMEGHGREESVVPGADITRTVGWFTTVYPVALDLTGVDTAAALEGGAATAGVLRAIKEQLLSLPDKGIGFGLLRHLDPAAAGELAGPVAQIGFNYLGRISTSEITEAPGGAAWLPTDALGELEVDQDLAMPASTVVDINAIVTDGETGPRMSVSFQYAAEILDEAAVRELAQDWVAALTAVARHVQDPAAGGLTPSDVPLVRATQLELDSWRQAYPGLSDVLPLSPLAEGFYFHSQLTAGAADDYVTQFALELAGTVDLERMRRAAGAILDRHAALRAAFVTAADGTPVQVVVDAIETPWQLVENVADEDIPALLEQDQRTRFDPAVAPLMRFTVYRTVTGRIHFVLTTHHLLFDGWSLPLLMKDLLISYATHGDASLLPPVRPYRDYLVWLARQDREATLEKWRTTLTGAQPTMVASVLERPAEPEIGYGEIEFELTEAETAAVTAFAANAEVTVNTVVQSAWALLLAALTDREDVVFGAVVSGRPPQLDGVDEMIGLFVNTIPVRVRFDAEWTVRELLNRVQSEQAGLLEHHYLGLAETQSAAGTGGAFDSLVAYESYPVDAEGLQQAGSNIDGLEVAGVKGVTFTHYPVTVVVESGARLHFKVWHRRDTVSEPAARALADLLRSLVGRFVGLQSDAIAPPANWWVATAPAGQLELPADRLRPAVPSRRGNELHLDLYPEVHSALDRLARRHDSTLFTVVRAAFAVLLARLSGGVREIPMGAITSESAAAPGVSIADAVVLRTEIDPATPFADLLDEVGRADAAALGRTGGAAERLADVLDSVRGAAGQPPFQVLITAGKAGYSNGIAQVDLQLDVTERAAATGVALTFTYATDLFEPATVQDFADRLARLLTAVAENERAVVGDIDLYAPGERDLVLHEWNTPGAPVPDVTLVDLITAQARQRPGAPAVRFGDETLSFDDLVRRSNRVARALIAYGAGPESLVAVAVPRTEQLPVALLSVLVAGAGYLPIDTAYPAQRLEFMLGDAKPACILTTSAERDAVPAGDIPVVLLDELAGFSDAPVTDADRRAPLRSDQLAYVIYTSGSTGVPKGVGVTHRNVVELFANTQAHFDFDEHDVWTLFHSFAFDFSVWELWCALANGGAVVVVDHLTSRSPEQFRELLIRERVTVLNQTPSAFYQLAEADRAAAAEDRDYALRYVVFGGEALDLRQLRRWYDRHPADAPRLVNMYGITETTVHVSFLALDEEFAEQPSSIIGRALPGLSARVLDQRLHPAPVGVAGEIYVDGKQLSRGYLGRPSLTASRFVANPYGPPGSRMYRAGDVGRWCGFGGEANLEYAGRSDQQVQLRGFRIELGEIESALLRLPGISQAVALVRTDNGVDQLVGYVVPEGELAIDQAALKAALGEFLTGYMVPDALVALEMLPLTPNGKLDRKALPAPEFGGSAEFRAPRTETERVVAAEFAALLGAAEVGVDDDFFSLGGNSLLATRAVARINEALDANLAVRDLFEVSTVAGLAAKVVAGAAEHRPALVRGERPERVPLSLAQQRMWILNQLDPDSPAYNIPLALRLSGTLDIEALRQAVLDVLERHESLRTRYPVDAEGIAYQEILPVEQALPGGLAVGPRADALHRMTAVLSGGFDVTAEVPVRALLCSDGAAGTEHYLVVVVHHITGDGASLAPLARDLVTAYVARTQGNSPAWSPLAVQYADFALWQREVIGTDDDENSVAAAQLAFWRDRLAGAGGSLDLPLDRPRPAVRTMQGGATTFTVPAEVHEGLQRIAREHNASLFMVVHAALAALLSRLSGSRDVVIGTPIAGRGERVLDDVVGMFVNTLALRTAVDSAAAFGDLVATARETDLAAFGNADIPFERVVEAVAPDRGAQGQDSLFQVVLSFQNNEQASLELPGLNITALDTGAVAAKFDLQVTIDPRQWEGGPIGEIAGAITYASDIFDEATIATFGERLQRLLAAVAADPRQSVGAIEFGGTQARPQTAAPVAETAAVTRGTQLPQLLTAAVEDDPDGPALVRGEDALSYAELDARSSRLARVLIGRGCGPGTGVAVRLDRGIDLVVATWAVLKSGAALVPVANLETELPAELLIKVGLTAAAGAAADGVDWLSLADPALVAEIAAASPRPVTYANRTRALQGADIAFVHGARTLGYDELAETVSRIGGATELTFESRTLRSGRPDALAAVVEVLAAGAGGASVVVTQIEPGTELTDVLAEEWVTHLFTDAAGVGAVGADPLEDLQAVIVDEGPAETAAARVPWVATVVAL